MDSQAVDISHLSDPSELEPIWTDLSQLRTLGEVKEYIDRKFPGLIVGFLSGWSDDYPQFTRNWQLLCDKSKVPRAQIVVFAPVDFADDSFQVANHTAGVFSAAGFCVRRAHEIDSCPGCNKAMLSKGVHAMLKEANDPTIPEEWSNICSSCINDRSAQPVEPSSPVPSAAV